MKKNFFKPWLDFAGARGFIRLAFAVLLLAAAGRAETAATGGESLEKAGETAAHATTAPASVLLSTQTETYRLGIGDMLEISTYGELGSASTVPVDPSGHITYRIVGTLPAAGRTIDEVRADLQQRIERELRHAIVTITPVRFGSQNFTVLGLVRLPGTYPLTGYMTVFDALATAGGLLSGSFRNSTADLFDLQHATLLRRGKAIPVDFDALIQRGDNSQNVPLENGDIITIPSALVRSIYITGEVNYSRTLGMVTAVSLLQALSEARGFKSTASGKVVIVRGSLTKPQVFEIDGLALLRGKTRDVMLAPGDIVYAPRPSLELLTDIVKAAVNSFATSAAAEAGADTFNLIHNGNPSSTRPVVTP